MVTFETGDFVAWLDEVERRLNDETQAAATTLAEDAVKAQREHGYQNKTGKLTASMRFRTMRTGGLGFLGVVETLAPYALWVDQPTRAHIIRARRAPYLVFYWRGAWHRRKSVKHPGTKGAHFSQAAHDTIEAQAHNRFQQAVDSAVQLSG